MRRMCTGPWTTGPTAVARAWCSSPSRWWRRSAPRRPGCRRGVCGCVCRRRASPSRQARAQELAGLPGLLLVAGRYEGLDERVVELAIDCELSVGDYVLSGGELPALTVIDALARLLPGALGR